MKACMFFAAVNLCALHQASATEADALDRVVLLSQRGQSLDTQMSVAEDLRAQVDVDDQEAVLLLRAGVSPAVLAALTDGTQPTPSVLSAASQAGDAWQPRLLEAAAPPQQERPNSHALEGPFFREGREFWTYRDDTVDFAVTLLREGRYTMAVVELTNLTDGRLNVRPSILGLGAGSGRVERVPPDQYLRRQTTTERVRLAFDALASVRTSQRATVRSEVIGPEHSGLSQSYTVDMPESTADAVARQAYRDQRQAESERHLDNVEERLLWMETLMPQQTVSGVVPFDYRAAVDERLVLTYFGSGTPVPIPFHLRR